MIKELFNLLIAFLYGVVYTSALWYFVQHPASYTDSQMQVLQAVSLLLIIFGSIGIIIFIMLFITTIYKES